jgi:hypothetical protein
MSQASASLNPTARSSAPPGREATDRTGAAHPDPSAEPPLAPLGTGNPEAGCSQNPRSMPHWRRWKPNQQDDVVALHPLIEPLITALDTP